MCSAECEMICAGKRADVKTHNMEKEECQRMESASN